MAIRVFLLLALFFCACDSAPEPSADENYKTPESGSQEVEEVVEYHPNGMVKLKGKTQNGKRFGKWVSFYPTGYRWSEASYSNGYRQGESVTYYPNGMMRYQGRYYNDERTGIWTFYDTTGAMVRKIDMDEVEANFKIDSIGLR